MAPDPLRLWTGTLPVIDPTDRAARLGLNPIVRARLDDRHEPELRHERYGSLLTHYELVDDPAGAEAAVFPFVYELVDRAQFVAFVREAERLGLRTLVVSGDDFEPVMPSESVILLHPGPTRGAQPKAHVLALPYLAAGRSDDFEPRPDGDRPSVAFCGQGAARPIAQWGQTVRRAALQVSNRIQPRIIAPPLAGHVGLRSTALTRLEEHRGVDDHFVIRDQYRAGVSSTDDRARTETEFDDNLRSATYALCIRGSGNFSARFYEALSLGRVPLFVNTNCVLPLEDQIDWRARCVWLESDDVDSIGDRLVQQHPTTLGDPSRSPTALRELWESHLTSDGYFSLLPTSIRALL